MAVVVVAFDGTGDRTSLATGADSNSATNWGNYNTGGGAPSSEAQLAYQGGLAVNKKVTSTTTRIGVDFDPASAPVDMTAVTDPLWFIKLIVSDSFDIHLTWGVEVAIGSAAGANNIYNISGTGANLSVYNTYPTQGGYLITAINPNITTWYESTTTPTLTAIDYWAGGCALTTGAAKNENFALDAIDVGRGLLLTRGDAGSPEGTFINFVATDQDVTTNRWGVVIGSGDAMTAHGLLTLGDPAGTNPTEVTDTTTILTFADGYHARGNVGVLIENNNASDIFIIGNLMIGEGTRNGVDANDTRPDFEVQGTSGIVTLTATLQNFRDVTYTSSVTASGSDVECHLLSPTTATIGSSTTTTIIRTNSLADVACVDSFSTGTPDITYTDFVQVGVGHAVLIDTAGTYTFDNLSFSGYGANDTASSAIDVTLVSASNVTINLTNTTQPTVNDTAFTGGGVVVFVATVSLTITVQDSNGVAIPGAEVAVYQTDGTEVQVWTSVDEDGIFVASATQGIGAVTIRVRQSANTRSFLTSSSTTDGVDDASDTINNPTVHKFHPGDAVVYSKRGGTQAIGLTDGTTYYVRPTDTTSVTVHATAINAVDNLSILPLTAGGTETHELNPIRYKNGFGSANIGTANVSTTITLITDNIVSDV